MRALICGLLVGVFGTLILASVVAGLGWVPLAANHGRLCS